MITIVNYGIGNLDSVARAFRHVGADAVVTSDAAAIAGAQGIVLPGVGSFGEAMENLRGHGLIEVLERRILRENVPALGICLGFQMLTASSEEGGAKGLGWIAGSTKQFSFSGADSALKVPHMGWNDAVRKKPSPLFEGVPEDSTFYFAHSYYVTCGDPSDILTTTEYGCEYVSSIQRGNLFGTQFHPEKSHSSGLKLVANFVKYCAHA